MSANEVPAAASARGLKRGSLGFVQSTAMGVASTAPAYSLAATLGWAVAAVGPQTLLLVPLAFIPMFFNAWANKEMNRADPDCGSSFTWAARALGPRTGWFAGGWGTIAADLLAMASQSQIAGQYFFLLFGLKSIGNSATSPWVLLIGVAWIVVLTYICYRGIEVSARLQVILLVIEVGMLLLLATVALIRVGTGHAPAGHAAFSWSWLDPAHFASPSVFMAGLLLMVFVYWGWDTTTSVNEETADPERIPGTAGVVSTLLLLGTYFVVILSVQMFAGFGSTGIGLNNAGNANDVLSPMGEAVFGSGTLGTVLSRLLILMVLSSAAASTQTTILPTARTTLSMAAYRALPQQFAKINPRYLTPTVSTIAVGVVSVALYIPLNFISGGNPIADAVTAIGLYIAFYYGLTAFSCAWYYRSTLRSGARNLWMRGILPLFGGLIMYAAGIYSLQSDWVASNSYTSWTVPGLQWQVGGIFVIAALAALAGIVCFVYMRVTAPAFFRRQTLSQEPLLRIPEMEL